MVLIALPETVFLQAIFTGSVSEDRDSKDRARVVIQQGPFFRFIGGRKLVNGAARAIKGCKHYGE